MTITASVTSLSIECKAAESCQDMSINAIIQNDLTLDCDGDFNRNCANVTLNVSTPSERTTETPIVDIICGNSISPHNPSDASCADANIYCGTDLQYAN